MQEDERIILIDMYAAKNRVMNLRYGTQKIHAGTRFPFSIQFEVMVSSAHANDSLKFICLHFRIYKHWHN